MVENQAQVKRTAVPADQDGGIALGNDKQIVISKMRQQNERLKSELKMLTGKLE